MNSHTAQRMQPALMIALMVVFVLTSAGASATSASAEAAPTPINDACPMSGNPIVPSAPTATVDGYTIGFCCGGCTARFEKWDDAKKQDFVQTTLAMQTAAENNTPGTPKGNERKESRNAKDDTGKPRAEPFTLNACPVSGRTLSEQEFPFTKMYDEREVRFCCRGCSSLFEKDQAKYVEQVDKAMIKAQLPYYPTDQCIVMNEPLDDMGEPVNIMHDNRLVRFCCKTCVRKFKRQPDDYLRKLDEFVKAKQRKDYPLDTCIIGGKDLGSMGDPHEVVISNRLVRLCCAGCERALRKDAPRYIAQIDEAWKKSGKMKFDSPAPQRKEAKNE